MVKRIALAVLAAGAMHAPPAQAGIYLSGNDLYADCTVPKDNPVYFSRTERCTGFVTGVVDATEGLRSLLGLPYCVPENVTLGQLNDVVRAYLIGHAAERTLAASALVLDALKSAYGCDSVAGK
jgi:hypothetical protein